MKNLVFIPFLVLFLVSCKSGDDEKILINNDMYLINLGNDIYVHVSSCNLVKYGRVSANGLVVKSGKHVVLIDTPWNDFQSSVLDKWIYDHWGCEIESVVPTHFHDDNLGGINYFLKKGTSTYAFDLTEKICKENDIPAVDNIFKSGFILKSGKREIVFFYPGPGHTVDNICAWVKDSEVLFGGCSVKSIESKNLGNLEDAVVDKWAGSLQNMKSLFGNARTVIPGHGAYGGMELIEHTISLAEEKQ